jgi:glycosyltransferase involved in cell wall biosynthesis
VINGGLDVPGDPVVGRGPVVFMGWAVVGTSPPASVEVVIDERRRVIAAELGIARPDVPIYRGVPETTSTSGWTATVDLADEPTDDLQVRVVVTDDTGRAEVVVDRSLGLRRDPPFGLIEPSDGAVIRGDLLIVRGWAKLGDAASIDIEVDGVILGRARLGVLLADSSEEVPTQYGPACGFEFRGTVGHLEGGLEHRLSVVVVDDAGNRSLLRSSSFETQAVALSRAAEEDAELLQIRNHSSIQGMVARRSARRDLLVFTHSLAIGGGQLYLQTLLHQVVPELTRCTVVAPESGELTRELQRLGVDVVICPLHGGASIAAYEGTIRALALFIKGSGCSSILLNTVGQFMAADAAQRVGVPTIWAIHESYEISDWLDLNGTMTSPYVRSRLEASLRATSRMVFESDATREMFVQAGVPATSAVTVPYGVDIDAIDAYATTADRAWIRQREGFAPDEIVILCMGVFEARKSQAWLVQAFARVADAHPYAVLVLVGDHECEYSNAVHELIESAGLEGRVRTVPISADVWHWYLLADVLVSASDVESFPRSMLEAMALGCPVLASAVHGVPELIADGSTGWLMRPRDHVALVAGLHRVLHLDAEERRVVASAGRDLVRTSYRAEGYASTYLSMIDELESSGERSTVS